MGSVNPPRRARQPWGMGPSTRGRSPRTRIAQLGNFKLQQRGAHGRAGYHWGTKPGLPPSKHDGGRSVPYWQSTAPPPSKRDAKAQVQSGY